MARVKEVDTRRPHQLRIIRAARRELNHRPGGIILADGVGLGKTYEALATAATLLAQSQHGRESKRRQSFRVLVLVPPGLVTKWATELEADHFLQYLKGWNRSPATRAVHRTFAEEVVILRRFSDLRNKRGNMRYGREVLPPGCYITNSNLLLRQERKATQLQKTAWDMVIVDEAHRIGGDLAALEPHTLLARHHTRAILLTATPFQLAPQEIQSLLSDTFGGYDSPSHWRRSLDEASAFYATPIFAEYRQSLSRHFRSGSVEFLRQAASLAGPVSTLLRERILRNSKHDKRSYFLVSVDGKATPLGPDIYRLGETDLTHALEAAPMVNLRESDIAVYLRVRDLLARKCRAGKRPFVAGTLRQLLSTYQQFLRSRFGQTIDFPIAINAHPKLDALANLVTRIVSQQLKRRGYLQRGWLEKILIFSTYVGADTDDDFVEGEDRHGSASVIKRTLEKRLSELIPKPSSQVTQHIRDALWDALAKGENCLTSKEVSSMRIQLRRFAGSRSAGLLLRSMFALRHEVAYFKRHLRAVSTKSLATDSEKRRRENDRRLLRIASLRDRYGTRDFVARYDGATHQEDRDRHLRGFNSPFCPLVLIASSVGQEGIDLQRYCSHVIHYDLEWNPARLEQREGRVDRQGREADGPVNVYFLICRGTYDERVLHVMVNRMRWHQVLLPNYRALAADPSQDAEPLLTAKSLKRVNLDLRPRS